MTTLRRGTGETAVTVTLRLPGAGAAAGEWGAGTSPAPTTEGIGARMAERGEATTSAPAVGAGLVPAPRERTGAAAHEQTGAAAHEQTGAAAHERAGSAIAPSRAAAPAPAGGIATGEPFLDHMLAAFARYSGLDLAVAARGDLRHHLVEDVAITLGLVLRRVVPATCRRYGAALVPMDDALVQVALDLGGRAYYEGPLPVPLAEHAFRSFATNAEATVHVVVLRGSDRHHVVEAAVKALGLALRQAVAPGEAVFSTKGAVSLEWEER